MAHDGLRDLLAPAFQAAFRELFGQAPDESAINFQPTRPEFEGDVTINVFPFLKLSGKGPEQTAKAVGERLQAGPGPVERFNAVKGFLNLVIADGYWVGFLQEARSR
ncbi:MAG: arginine--tRNA ligase, partial [Flavobacteriales bacterium]